MATFVVKSCKAYRTVDGELRDAIALARRLDEEYQPAFGTWVEHAGETGNPLFNTMDDEEATP